MRGFLGKLLCYTSTIIYAKQYLYQQYENIPLYKDISQAKYRSHRGSRPEVFRKKGLRPATFFKKETLAQAFSCVFWEISKNTFFTEQLRWLLLKRWSYSLKLQYFTLHFACSFN